MNIFPRIQNTIGTTPLVRIGNMAKGSDCDILAKLEFSSLYEAGMTLIEIKNAIARQIFESKQRDDVRGVKITKGYNEAHVLAKDNEFVKTTMDQTHAYEEQIRNYLKSPQVGA